MSSEVHQSRLLLAIGCAVVYALACVSVASPVPTAWSPYPATQFGLMTAGVSRAVSFLLVPLVFVAWNAIAVIRPYRGGLLHLAVLAGPLTIGSFLYFAVHAHTGPPHQGVQYTAAVIVINLALLSTFWWGWWSSRRRPCSRRAVLLGMVLFGWLAWCAFPYFGELI